MSASLWDTIVGEAARESSLWADALLPREQRQLLPVFSPLGRDRYALATESIYEGYLLHYGRPRLFRASDADTAVLLGDYLYAHGLVRLAALGDVGAVADLAELISLCTQLRAAGLRSGDADGAAWAATAAQLGSGDGQLERARAALRLSGDPSLLERLAAGSAGEDGLQRALAAHRTRVK
jgi:hypothetical protein